MSDMPKTINEALKILAYNDYLWGDPTKKAINAHPKDRATVSSLAESQYAWTEKQARLALVILKRYLTKFQAHGMDIKSLLDDPKYDEQFREINFKKTIQYISIEDEELIEVRFPYHKKVIQLIRCLKDKRDLPAGYSSYDGESKKWLFKKTDVTTYYLTLIAARYDFEFLDKKIIKDYDNINKSIKNHKIPTATIVGEQVCLSHAPESMLSYWQDTQQDKPLLHQIDALKNIRVDATQLVCSAENQLALKIANNNHHKLWIDSKTYSKQEVVRSLFELDAFPLVMPCHSDLQEENEVEEFWEWLNVFKINGIDILKDCSWGFDLREPIYRKDVERNNERTYLIDSTKSRQFFENLYELHQMSKQFKFIDKKTKILFVRNRIPRALIKSKIQPKTSLIALGGGYYAGGTENLKRLLENLPKKLYYSDHQPSSWDWNDRIIQKI